MLNYAVGRVMLLLYSYFVGNIFVVYVWLLMSCWTYGENNNIWLLDKIFVDSNNKNIS